MTSVLVLSIPPTYQQGGIINLTSMRPIKFRSFNRVNKNWTYIFLEPEGKVRFQYPTGGSMEENMEPWQEFSGLLDKNGKEIYEGDIVKWRSHPDPMKQGEVKWGSCGYYIVWFDNDLERERNFPRSKHLGGHLNSIEVIGNIYENPELLNL